MSQGVLGAEFDRSEQAEVKTRVKEAEDAAKDEVWSGYRHAVLADSREADGLRTIDLGAGHSSARETLCGRVVEALKTEALLNETVSVGYLGRQWPPAFKDSGAWPLTSLRQSFLDGSLTRLRDPDATLRHKIVEFVRTGSFGLGSGPQRRRRIRTALVRRGDAERRGRVRQGRVPREEGDGRSTSGTTRRQRATGTGTGAHSGSRPAAGHGARADTCWRHPGNDKHGVKRDRADERVCPSESWNRLGTKVISKLRSGTDLHIEVQCSVKVSATAAANLESEIKQALNDLGLQDVLKVQRS